MTTLFAIVLFPILTLADPPATQPQAPTEQEIPGLIRQLDHPSAKQCRQASAALRHCRKSPCRFSKQPRRKPHPPKRPPNSRTSSAPSASVLGAVIVHVLGDSQADNLDMQPGDIIVEINGHTITNERNFDEATAAAKDRPRHLTVRRGDEILHFTVEPGKIGVDLDDYRSEYGQPLLAAIKAYNEPDLPAAAEQFEAAKKAGLKLRPDGTLTILDAVFSYCRGDVDRSTNCWPNTPRPPSRPAAGRSSPHTSITSAKPRITSGSTPMTSTSPPIPTISTKRSTSATPSRDGSTSRRASVRAVNVLTTRSQQVSDYGRAVGVHTIAAGFASMNLKKEALALAPALLKADPSAEQLDTLEGVAETQGNPKLAGRNSPNAPCVKRAARGKTNTPGMAAYSACSCAMGREREARARVKAMTASQLEEFLNYGVFHGMAWPKAQSIMADVCRRVATRSKLDRRALNACLDLLICQPNPSLTELEDLLKRDVAAYKAAEEDPARSPIPLARVQTAMLREDYAAAIQGKDEGYRSPIGPPTPKVRRFLQAHAATLTGDRAIWKNLFQAYALPAGGWILVTRDFHLGLATGDAGSIRELPARRRTGGFSNTLKHWPCHPPARPC